VVNLKEWSTKVDTSALVLGLPALGTASFTLAIAGDELGVSVSPDGVTLGAASASPDFTYSLESEDWGLFTHEPPPRGYTSAQAIRATKAGANISGDVTTWAQYSVIIDRVMEALRAVAVGPRAPRHADPAPLKGRSPIEAGYIGVDIGGETKRLYFEASGVGPTVLCLHTAGSDSRQFRYLMEDAELTKKYRFVAFDMPWHGRSDPPADWATRTYALTTKDYSETVFAFMEAMKIEKPILMGCSMGGAIAIYLASTAGEKFTAVFGLEGGLGNAGRFVPWTNAQEIDHSHFLTSWVGGLISPTSPTGPRNLTLWGYAQSGPGVYQGDTNFYSRDLPEKVKDLGPVQCPLWVFSGEYDYSATTEMSQAAIDKVGGELVVMTGSGHFPMAEDPVVFKSFLQPVLERVTGNEKG
jgi:pimeloyl-ACP methyl ester carboxylesterase